MDIQIENSLTFSILFKANKIQCREKQKKLICGL